MDALLRRPAALAAAACLLVAAPAAAQDVLPFGRTVQGALDAGDPRMSDDSHYDLWRFQGTAGQRVVVTLRSEDFDAFLVVGPTAGDGCTECEIDDDGAGGTDSRVRLTLPRTGTYEVRANSLAGGETGAYSLTLEEEAPLTARGEIRAGETVRGELDGSDAAMNDGSSVELWTYRGRPGERIVITQRSGDFDAYLGWGRLVDGGWEEIESDDDSAGGTDSRLEVTVGANGVHHIAAGALLEGEAGAYTLTVERG